MSTPPPGTPERSPEIDLGAAAVAPAITAGGHDGEGHRGEGDRSAIFDAAQAVRGFGRRFADLPAGFADNVEVVRLWHRRPAPAGWSALQHAAHFADLLAGVAADLSYLLKVDRRAHFELAAGPEAVSNDLDPDVVLAVLAADAERVARLLEGAPAHVGAGSAFPIAAGGVILSLAQKAVRDGTFHLHAAHAALQADFATTSVMSMSRVGANGGGRDDQTKGWTSVTDTGIDDGNEAAAGRKSKLSDTLADMAGLLFDEIALESLLQLVVSLARSTLDAADEASVSVVHAGIFETITATSPAVRDLDHVQYESGRGPCVAATRSGKPITTGFDHDTGRWPEFTRAVRAQGFRGVLAIPLTAGTRRLGAVNLYSRSHAIFAASDAAGAQVFADHAAVALANAVSFTNARILNGNLGEALETRDLIGLAKGILMNRDDLSAAEASEVLRQTSRRQNTTLRELSKEIIDRGRDVRGPQGQL